MTAPLDRALRELARTAPGGEHEIDRVSVAGDGTLALTLATKAGQRWFTWESGGLVERRPGEDARLPLGLDLAGAGDRRVLSYRPGRRLVIESNRDGRPCVLKGHRPGRVEDAGEKHVLAERAAERGSFPVPRLLGREAERAALRFERVEGRRPSIDVRSAADFHALGSALARFQVELPAEGLQAFGVRDELGVVDEWRRRVELATGTLPESWTEGRRMLDDRAGELPPARLGACHRDLHDGQVLVAPSGPLVLDFDLLCRADLALDPANLLVHLELRALQGLRGADARGVRVASAAFLDGLGPAADEGFGARLAFYQATSFLRLSLLYSLRPRWQRLAPRLAALAAQRIEELVAGG